MTTKEMLNAIIAGTINDEVQKKAAEMLAAADKKNSKRAGVAAENKSANAAIAEEVAAKMTDGQELGASEILTLLAADHPDMKLAKVTPIMAEGVAAGLFTVRDDYKVGGKGRKVNGYTKVAATE